MKADVKKEKREERSKKYSGVIQIAPPTELEPTWEQVRRSKQEAMESLPEFEIVDVPERPVYESQEMAPFGGRTSKTDEMQKP